MKVAIFVIALSNAANAYFILSGPPIVSERLDPIVSPGAIASHMHVITGASNFHANYTYDNLRQSECTVLPVQDDLSNYWVPGLYSINQTDGSFTAMPSYFNIYYLPRNATGGSSVTALPNGLRILAGDPSRRTYNASSLADRAVSYVCQEYSGAHRGNPEWDQRPSFFNHNQCPQGMRSQIVFPSCWNGVDLDSADHKSHMAYPDGVDNGKCPATHPVRLVTLFYEMISSVQNYPHYGNQSDGAPYSWTFSMGDPTGYGFHGDVTVGWNATVLQQALDDVKCDIGSPGGSLSGCPAFIPSYDTSAAAACKPGYPIVDEDYGYGHSIPTLTGCNPVWDGKGTKPACGTSGVTPSYKSPVSTPATGFSYVGCLAEAPSGRLFTGASTTSDSMTVAVCTSFCADKGFPYAGVEFGRECYCGLGASNGGTLTPVADNQCTSTSAGLSTEIGGGSRRLSTYYNPSLVPAAPTLPTGWNATGCLAEASGRLLKGYSFTSSSMTVGLCVSTCASKNYIIAGVEYASECYCSNSTAINPPASSTACSMSCSGSSTTICGGPNALTTFTYTPPPVQVYTAQGCVQEGTNGRLLTGASFTSSNMSIEVCSSFCASKQFGYMGVEYASECYCSNFLSNPPVTSDTNTCNMACKGSKTQTCGGSSRLSLYSNPAWLPTPLTLPSGWTSQGCVAESVNGRLLKGASFANSNMTVVNCIDGCVAKGFNIAGVEYSSECYCASSTNFNVTTATSTKCNMPCSGDAKSICGGPSALSLYTGGSTS